MPKSIWTSSKHPRCNNRPPSGRNPAPPLPLREEGLGEKGGKPTLFPRIINTQSPDTKKPALGRFCHACQFLLNTILPNGASGENRTPTLSPEADFESAASTNSATEALDKPRGVYGGRCIQVNALHG